MHSISPPARAAALEEAVRTLQGGLGMPSRSPERRWPNYDAGARATQPDPASTVTSGAARQELQGGGEGPGGALRAAVEANPCMCTRPMRPCTIADDTTPVSHPAAHYTHYNYNSWFASDRPIPQRSPAGLAEAVIPTPLAAPPPVPPTTEVHAPYAELLAHAAWLAGVTPDLVQRSVHTHELRLVRLAERARRSTGPRAASHPPPATLHA